MFASFAEQRGFVGTSILLLLYLLVVWRGLRVVTVAGRSDLTPVAGGIVFAFLFQVFVNVGMTMGIAPVTGIPLPFVTVGGSSMVANLMAVGPESVDAVDVPDPERVAWLSQTTLSVDETEETVRALRTRFPALLDPPSDDICYATQNRQEAVKPVAADADLVIVVGSRNSSNSVRLVEVARTAGASAAYLVDGPEELDAAWLDRVTTVGVTSGASVPEVLVDGVLAWLAERGSATSSGWSRRRSTCCSPCRWSCAATSRPPAWPEVSAPVPPRHDAGRQSRADPQDRALVEQRVAERDDAGEQVTGRGPERVGADQHREHQRRRDDRPQQVAAPHLQRCVAAHGHEEAAEQPPHATADEGVDDHRDQGHRADDDEHARRGQARFGGRTWAALPGTSLRPDGQLGRQLLRGPLRVCRHRDRARWTILRRRGLHARQRYAPSPEALCGVDSASPSVSGNGSTP